MLLALAVTALVALALLSDLIIPQLDEALGEASRAPAPCADDVL